MNCKPNCPHCIGMFALGAVIFILFFTLILIGVFLS